MTPTLFRRTNWYPFNGGSFWEYIDRNRLSIENDIKAQPEDYILNANEQDLLAYFKSKHEINIPILYFDNITADDYEALIPAEWFGPSWNVTPGKSYPKKIVRYYIPLTGDYELLNFRPSKYTLGGWGNAEMRLTNTDIELHIINFNNDTEQIKRDYNSCLGNIQFNYTHLLEDLEAFNQSIGSTISTQINARKQALLRSRDVLSSLGVPLRSKSNAPETFSVPKPTIRQSIIVKPVVHEKGFKPEPTLDQANYELILKYIDDVGKNLERLPSLYKDKKEEDLRDYFLLILDPNFQMGSASGETFNKTGKTDISLRYDSSVVFISECKIWAGSKAFLKTIDQLLAYLTWRDTKAAIIIFAKQADISGILSKIEEITPQHPNFLRVNGKSNDNWFNYVFHINGDRNREVKLAVMVYHLPIINSN